MSKVFRFGISLEKNLLDAFDQLIKERNYSNRSEAFRDLIRQELVKKEWQDGKEVAGVINLIYDHHQKELLNKIMDIQHDFQEIIISTQHIHLDHSNCLEIIALKGSPEKVMRLSNILRSMKNVKHGGLSMSTTGKNIK